MNIFENLENLNVSEECFEDIMSIVEDLLQDTKAVRRNAELNVKRGTKTAKELKKQRNIADRKEQIAWGDAVTLKDLADYQTDKTGKNSEEAQNVRGHAADAIKTHRKAAKELKNIANAYTKAKIDVRNNKFKAERAQNKVNALTGN